jgi:outer membrane murein-binding lipoprotein Lpp
MTDKDMMDQLLNGNPNDPATLGMLLIFRAETKYEFRTIRSELGILKSDGAVQKSDIATLKSDVATLKSDVATLKSDVAAMKSDIADLKKIAAATAQQVALLVERLS